MLTIPVTYQGGKHRLAAQIVKHIEPRKYDHVYDLCCGGGSISIELVNQGIDPSRITMVDKGPWGMVWEQVGKGTFDIDMLRTMCNDIPSDPALIKDYVYAMSQQPVGPRPYLAACTFLILQAASFGGKAVWIKDGQWKTSNFRKYWTPTPTSNRRSPVNPMMPMPDTLVQRMEDLINGMRGVNAYHADVQGLDSIDQDSVVYIDPPYQNTTKYGHQFDVVQLASNLKADVFVSEGEPLNDQAICLSQGRSKGGISGKRSSANEEWLSPFRKAQ